MVRFQHIEYLLALALVPLMVLVFLYVLRSKKNTIKKIGDPALVNQLIKDYSPSKFLLKFLLIVVAFVAGVIALANPRMPQGSTMVNRSGIDVMIALDVSKSMLADDIKPNRLERAKQFIAKLIDKLPNDRIGIVVFAGRAYLQMPLTTDHSAAKMYLSSATPDVVPTQGTVIGDALKMCYNAFNTKEKKYKSVVLISDGEDHDKAAEKITKAMADEGVMINTVGIGSPEGTTIIDPATGETKMDAEGRPVITKLNEQELKSIAGNGNGLYQLFTNTDEIVDAMDKQLQSMGQRSVTENSLVNFRNFFPWLLGLSLALLLTEFFISEVKKIAKVKKVIVKKEVAVLTVLFILPSLLFAQNSNTLIKNGNDAYNKKEYDVAADNYKKAADKEPNNEKAQYNLGNAFYKKGNADDALQAYDAAIKSSKSKSDQSASWYNKGVSLQNNKKLPECIDAYKNALKLNPADEDARFNLQKALLQQQKEQQQKEQQDKEKKKPKDDKQKNKQQQEKEQQQPKPQPSKMTKKEAEEKLKALLQQEKNLQNKLRRVDVASPDKPEKDW
ncbi:VWA domain-containing protein [Ferruginibacter paludis]|uniref:VWA domain-containing protein n=1 Tax=Ferruginibacter paludis TaxID=1310417 RepID=UPI0025B58EE9|nr:VWA domain-containing protein [Ferruginibacter paludis]MDN3658493.1 VWA domain-containing protein [Ferruginibacter paludis]